LFGLPGHSYAVERATNVFGPWAVVRTFTLTNRVERQPFDFVAGSGFYRARDLSAGPALAIVRAGAGFLVSWPAACAGCVLESAPTPLGPWTETGTPPQIVDGQARWNRPAQGPSRFYRLRLR
jgi:hypothetical protein